MNTFLFISVKAFLYIHAKFFCFNSCNSGMDCKGTTKVESLQKDDTNKKRFLESNGKIIEKKYVSLLTF